MKRYWLVAVILVALGIGAYILLSGKDSGREVETQEQSQENRQQEQVEPTYERYEDGKG